MVKCSPDCTPICDFCAHYKHDKPFGGFGLCSLHGGSKHCTDGCNDFHCGMLDPRGEETEKMLRMKYGEEEEG